jgi:hypothetical protein
MQFRCLSLLLLAMLAVAEADTRRRLLARRDKPHFKLKDRPGGAVKFLQELDDEEPGRVSKILLNSGIENRQKAIKLLDIDDDL